MINLDLYGFSFQVFNCQIIDKILMTEQLNTNPTQSSQFKEKQNQIYRSSNGQQSRRQSDLINKQGNNQYQGFNENSGEEKEQVLQPQFLHQRKEDLTLENYNQSNKQDECQQKFQERVEKHSQTVDQQVEIQQSDPQNVKANEEQGEKDQLNECEDDKSIKENSNILQSSQYQRYLQKEEERENGAQDFYQQKQYNYDSQAYREVYMKDQIESQISQQMHYNIDKSIIKEQIKSEIKNQYREQEIIQFTDDDIPLKNIRNQEIDYESANTLKSKDFNYAGIEDQHLPRQEQKKMQNNQLIMQSTVISQNISIDTSRQPKKNQETVFVKQKQKLKVIERKLPQARQNHQQIIKEKQVEIENPSPFILTKGLKDGQSQNKITKVEQLPQLKSVKQSQARAAQNPIKESKREQIKQQNPVVNKAPKVKKVKKVTKVAKVEVQQKRQQITKNIESTIPIIKQIVPPQKNKEEREKIIIRDLPESNPPPSKPNPNTSTVRITVMSTDQDLPQATQSRIPVLTSLMVVSSAVKQRVETTYTFFLKYIFEYQKTVNYYKSIAQNVYLQIEKRKNSKMQLKNILLDYFANYAKLNREFYQRCYKIQSFEQKSSANRFQNIKAELKPGYQQLIFLRKSIANDSHKIAAFISNHINVNIIQAFQNYNATIGAEQKRQIDRRIYHLRRETILKKLVAQIDKNFNRGLVGKEKEDIFIEIIKLVNEERIHRQSLKNYGRGLIDLRHAYIHSERELFSRLQQILNSFKTHSRTVYSVGQRQFYFIEDLTSAIKVNTKFAEISNLTDLDYIKYVLELQSKRQTTEFTNRHFQQYLDLVYFDKIVGNIKDLYKGATTKIFPMEHNGEELIHTISGNLVYFNRQRDELRDKFVVKNLNVKMMGQGVVEFDEIIKGIIFDDNRTLRLKLKDADRAEELICYLNQKQENIVLSGPVLRVL